jgi:hypothetical protein
MSRNPSMKMAEWIRSQMSTEYRETADDVYDVLLGNITSPRDFVEEVKYLAVDYEDDFRRHNDR